LPFSNHLTGKGGKKKSARESHNGKCRIRGGMGRGGGGKLMWKQSARGLLNEAAAVKMKEKKKASICKENTSMDEQKVREPKSARKGWKTKNGQRKGRN